MFRRYIVSLTPQFLWCNDYLITSCRYMKMAIRRRTLKVYHAPNEMLPTAAGRS